MKFRELAVVLALLGCDRPDENQTAAVTNVDAIVGDCNGDGRVTIDELGHIENIMFDRVSIDTCRVADADGDGVIRINELISAERNPLYPPRHIHRSRPEC